MTSTSISSSELEAVLRQSDIASKCVASAFESVCDRLQSLDDLVYPARLQVSRLTVAQRNLGSALEKLDEIEENLQVEQLALPVLRNAAALQYRVNDGAAAREVFEEYLAIAVRVTHALVFLRGKMDPTDLHNAEERRARDGGLDNNLSLDDIAENDASRETDPVGADERTAKRLSRLRSGAIRAMLAEHSQRVDALAPSADNYLDVTVSTVDKVRSTSADVFEIACSIARALVQCGAVSALGQGFVEGRAGELHAAINRCADKYFPLVSEHDVVGGTSTISHALKPKGFAPLKVRTVHTPPRSPSTANRSVSMAAGSHGIGLTPGASPSHRTRSRSRSRSRSPSTGISPRGSMYSPSSSTANSVSGGADPPGSQSTYDKHTFGMLTVLETLREMILTERIVADKVLPDSVLSGLCYQRTMGVAVDLVSSVGLERAHRSVRNRFTATQIVFVFSDVVEWLHRNIAQLTPVLNSGYIRDNQNSNTSVALKRLGNLLHQWIKAAQEQLQVVPEELSREVSRAPKNGMVHSVSSAILNYIRRLYAARATIAPLCAPYLDRDPSTFVSSAGASVERATAVAFSRYVSEVLRVLDSCMNAKARVLKPPSLAALFVVNNLDYIFHGITSDTGIAAGLGARVVQARKETLQKAKALYSYEATAPVVQMIAEKLREAGLGSDTISNTTQQDEQESVATQKLATHKEMFGAVAKWVEAAHSTHCEYAVPNPNLRTELRMQVRQSILPPYQIAYDNWHKQVGTSSSPNKRNATVPPPSLVSTTISQFFEGSEHLSPSGFRFLPAFPKIGGGGGGAITSPEPIL